MNEASWDRLTDAIDIKFGIDRHGAEERPLDEAPHLHAKVVFVEFERAGEKYRLERITGPAIIDRKSVGARRAGSSVRFENVYDPTETATRIVVLKNAGEEWEEVNPEELGVS